MKIIRDYIERIRNTRKFAREQNVPVWEIPLINSIGLIILGSIYLGFWSWTLIIPFFFFTKDGIQGATNENHTRLYRKNKEHTKIR